MAARFHPFGCQCAKCRRAMPGDRARARQRIAAALIIGFWIAVITAFLLTKEL